jgi:5,10-methenyltetrahydrofolate synthetase
MPDPSTDAYGIAQFRKNIRLARIAEREALPPQQRAALTARIESHLAPLLARLAPAVLGFCWPYRGEPDLRAFIAAWLQHAPGRQAALPVVIRKQAPMVFRAWTPEARMALDPHGIPVPDRADEIAPDAVLVPLNAFDANGYRLGYGGGYFDRTLSALTPPPRSIGVAFELARTDSVQPQPHDHPMDYVVTEAGVVFARDDG